MKNNKLRNFFNYKLNYFFKYTLWTPFRVIRNWIRCLIYPFWKARNIWSDKSWGYKFTYYDDIAEGWRKAFGKKLSRELKKSLVKNKLLKEFRFSEIKEKWGSLCLYNFGADEETQNLLHKYELASMGYCMFCGKPARYKTSGYILYLCENCFEFNLKHRQEDITEKEVEFEKREHRLEEEDIPVLTSYVDGYEHQVDLKEEYGLDFHEMWRLPKSDKK